jgi:F0F1-type ATP synthase membrane subunit b/b'
MSERGLDQLIETERRLALRLAEARASADAIVAAARRAAQQEAERFEAELAAAERELAARIAAEHEAEIAAIRKRADHELARLHAFPDAAIGEIAASLLDQALAARPEDEA